MISLKFFRKPSAEKQRVNGGEKQGLGKKSTGLVPVKQKGEKRLKAGEGENRRCTDGVNEAKLPRP